MSSLLLRTMWFNSVALQRLKPITRHSKLNATFPGHLPNSLILLYLSLSLSQLRCPSLFCEGVLLSLNWHKPLYILVLCPECSDLPHFFHQFWVDDSFLSYGFTIQTCPDHHSPSSKSESFIFSDFLKNTWSWAFESWNKNKAEHWRNDAFELWCWRRLLRVPGTVRKSNQPILKEISSEYSLEGLMLKLKL